MAVEALGSNVLVLNKLWQVTDLCSARRAICLVYLRHAQIVVKQGGSFYTFGFQEWRDFSRSAHGDDVIRTISFHLKIPRIILLLLYDRLPPQEVKFTRRNIFKRDRNTCQYCGKRFRSEDLNLDHVIPLSRGGKHTWDNVVCSCVPCNLHKGDRLLSRVDMHLIRKPRKPMWKTFFKDSYSETMEQSWHDFLDMAYWNVELEEDN